MCSVVSPVRDGDSRYKHITYVVKEVSNIILQHALEYQQEESRWKNCLKPTNICSAKCKEESFHN